MISLKWRYMPFKPYHYKIPNMIQFQDHIDKLSIWLVHVCQVYVRIFLSRKWLKNTADILKTTTPKHIYEQQQINKTHAHKKHKTTTITTTINQLMLWTFPGQVSYYQIRRDIHHLVHVPVLKDKWRRPFQGLFHASDMSEFSCLTKVESLFETNG